MKPVLYFFTFLFCLVAASTAHGQTHTARPNTPLATKAKGYYEYLPEGYDPNGTATYPLILFMHGIGEFGDGSASKLPLVLKNGITKLIEAGTFPKSFVLNGETHRFVIITPQFVRYPEAADMDVVLNSIIAKYKVNTSRIYITGLSYGGGLTFAYAGNNNTYAQRVAAIVPVASPMPDGGDAEIRDRSRVIAANNVPVWATHNRYDTGVDTSAVTIAYVNYINQNPAPTPRAGITLYENAGHDAWTKTYNPSNKIFGLNANLNIYEWMLQYQRGTPPPPNQAPVANAGSDQTITLPANSVSLSGTGTDSDGNIVAYAWTKQSGPAATITSPNAQNTTVTGLVQGTYVFRLTVTDNKGATGFDDVTVIVNAPPQANAGADQTITLPTNSVSLTGGGTDGDGSITAHTWSKVSGPAAGSITTPNAQNTTVTGLAQGTYVFRLTVTDNRGATATDDVTITVNATPNQAPVANAGADQTITLPATSVTLNGSGSTDSDGSIATYNWTKLSGPAGGTIAAPNAANTQVTALQQGSYVFRLTVRDNSGTTASDDVTVTVNAAPNQLPVANAGPDQVITLPANNVTLDGSGSTDSDGNIASYSWTKISGAGGTITTPNAKTTTVTGLQQGSYVFRLTVTDNSGATAMDDITITVNAAPNKGPVANAGTDQSITLPANSVTLSGSGSDEDGVIRTYAWTKTAGPNAGTITNAGTASTTVTGLVEGVYTFRLTVADDDGATAVDDVIITVNAAPNQAPTANAGADQTITLPANSVTLTGTASDNDGNITAYNWTKVSGPAGETISSPASATTTVAGLIQGSYVFRLTVTDDDGATARDDLSVVVNAAPNVAPQANAGSDQSITLPTNTVTLTGTATDSDGNITARNWTKMSGPAAGTITTPASLTTTVTGLVQGSYIFRLTVTDDDGATASDDVTITVNPAPNQAPVADAGDDQNITLPANSVNLNGTATDSDGTISNITWAKTEGPTAGAITNPGAAVTTVTGMAEGSYIFRLIVTDNNGASDTDYVKITVNAAANKAPIANAGIDVTITLPVNQTALSGSGSDEDGQIVSYLWTKTSGPSSGAIVSKDAKETSVTGLVEGIYVFRLTVTDNKGTTGFDEVQVTVNAAPNVAPVADAGADQTIVLPTSTTTLNGSGIDSDGTITAYNWVKVSGPDGGMITAPAVKSTTVTGLQQGSYVFRLTVTDNKGTTGSDNVTITVNAAPNQIPVANAGADQTITLPTNSVTLNGAGIDNDGNISTYSWAKISGSAAGSITSPNAATTTVTGLASGTYVFRLTVTDNSGATAIDDVTVTVNAAPNELPTVNAGTDQTITLPANSVTLTGVAADADGSIANYTWTKVSGPVTGTISTPDKAVTNVTGLVQGLYVFRLTITDDDGATAADDVKITVNTAANKAPAANAGNDLEITLPVNNVNLSGTGTDEDGTIASYLWTKTSGPAEGVIVAKDAAATSVTGLVQGNYVFRLTVTDNDGATNFDELTITVNAAPNQLPVASAGADQTIILPVNNVTLNGSATDTDGSIITYNWTKISGPEAGSITTPAALTTSVTGLTQGSYVFRLTVTDNDGATGSDEVTITVNSGPNVEPVANAGEDQSIALPVNSVSLSGTGTDSDGSITSYSWTKVSGPAGAAITTPNAAATAVTGLVEGSYVFRFTVTDNRSATASDNVTITVTAAPNQAPQAAAGADQQITLPTSTATLNGSGIDTDGTISSYAWTKVSGPDGGAITTPNTASTTVTGLQQGNYVFRLTVTDNNGATASDEIAIEVTIVTGIDDDPSLTTFNIITMPNPTRNHFSLKITSPGVKPLYLRMTDAIGRVVEERTNVQPNATITIGHNYKLGVYHAELFRNGRKITVKLLKL